MNDRFIVPCFIAIAIGLSSACSSPHAAVATGGQAAFELPAGEVKFETGKATLSIGDKEIDTTVLAPVPRAAAMWQGKRLTVAKSVVRLFSEDGAELLWTASRAEAQELRFIGAQAATAYFIALDRDEDERLIMGAESSTLLPLDLETGQWQEPLRLPLRDILEPPAFAAHEGRFAVAFLEKPEAGGSTKFSTCRVFCFGESGRVPIWSREIPLGPGRHYSGVLVMGIPNPEYAHSGVRPLTWMGDQLIVCAEAQQPILSLNSDTGETLWEIKRLWEFDRGFVGPSVYSYFIDRFGLGTLDLDEEEEVPDEEWMEEGEPEQEDRQQGPFLPILPRTQQDSDSKKRPIYTGSLVGGPVIVPLDLRRDRDRHRIFVAVALENIRQTYGGHLAKSRIYEIDERGKLIALLDLPFVLEHRGYRVVDGALVWPGHQDSLLKIRPSRTRDSSSVLNRGGSNGLAQLDWLRQVHTSSIEGWLQSGPSRVLPAISRKFALYQQAGGTVIARENSVYRFPLALVSLDSGSVHQLTLEVPFRGVMPPPETNFRWEQESFAMDFPHKLGVQAFEVVDGRIRIDLITDEARTTVSFPFRADALK